MAQIFDDLADGRVEPRAGIVQLEQAPIGGRGDLLGVLESLAVEMPRRAGSWPERAATAGRKSASGALREARCLALLA